MNIPTQQKSKARTSFSTAPLKQPAEKTVPAFEIDNFYKEALRDNATYLILSALLVVILQANVTKHYWEYLYTTQSHFVIAKAITCSMTTGIYLVLSAVFMYFDLMGESSFMWKFKTQQQKKPTIQDYIKCGKTILLNQSIVTCILFYKELKSKQIRQELPSAGEVLLHVAFSWLVREVAFYYSHRAAHHPLIYKHIHKQHHMYTAPIAFAAMYAHPIEHLVCNSLPIALGPLLIQNKIHIVTVWSWLALSYINTIFNHCGYDIWGLPPTLFHDYHHKTFNYNFGSIGFLDWFHKTDGGYHEYRQQFIHRKEKSGYAVSPTIIHAYDSDPAPLSTKSSQL